jgi:hypothetical protein
MVPTMMTVYRAWLLEFKVETHAFVLIVSMMLLVTQFVKRVITHALNVLEL